MRKLRNHAIILILLLFSLGTLNAGNSSIYMRLSTGSAKEHPYSKASEYFAKLVSRSSEGRIRIRTMPLEKGEREEDILQQLSFGGITFAIMDGTILMEILPSLNDIIKTEGLSRDSVVEDVFSSLERINSALEDMNIMVISVYPPKLRGLFSSGGLYDKVGTTGRSYYTDRLASQKLIPYEISLDDAARLLLNDAIDAVEAPVSDFSSSDAYSFVHFASLDKESAPPVFLLMNRSVYEKLEEDDRNLIINSAELSRYYATSLLRRTEETLLVQLKKEKKLKEEEV